MGKNPNPPPPTSHLFRARNRRPRAHGLKAPCARRPVHTVQGPWAWGPRAHGTRVVGTGYPEDFDRKKLVGLWLNANSYQDPKEHSRLTSEHVAEEIQHY